MIRLYYSNHLDALIAPLADAVARAQRSDPLVPVQIVVPNRVVEQFIKRRVAEEVGIAANLRFPFLRAFLRRAVEAAEPDIHVVEADQLQAVIFEALRQAKARQEPKLKPATDYIAARAGTLGDSETRTMQLAGRIAALLREYSISREQLLDSWRRDRRQAEHAVDDPEQWQSALWRTIFDERRFIRARFLTDSRQRWMLLPDAMAAIDPRKLASAVRGPIHVFGLAYVGAAFARIFQRVSRVSEVEIYALNPCREFWEDIDTSRRSLREGWAHRGDKIGTALDESDDPFHLRDADNLALEYWGRPGREYIRLLNELTDCEFEPHFVDADEQHAPSILQRFQADILNRRQRASSLEPGAGARDDGSIRFLACPSVPREVEIVANKIWSLIKNDDSEGRGAPLRFHEIAIVMPEASRDLYLPHIEAAFRRLHDIPLDVVTRSFASRSRVAEAIELILDLPLGRFTREQMLRLMTHPAIIGDGGVADVEQWPTWTRALGVYLGADDADLDGTYIHGLYHWDQALKRLALGIFMEARPDEERFFELHGEGHLLPLGLAQSEIDNVALMVRLARGLIDDALKMRTGRMSLKEWSRFLSELIATYIPQGGAPDERVRARCLDAIESIAHEEFAVDPVSYEAAHTLVRERIAGVERDEGRLSARGVAVGSFSALQSIPFKVIFALGLGEGTFPERDRRDPLDLRGKRRKAGDVSPIDRDRYLFLQTLLAAREKLFLCYVAREPQTGDPLAPSSTIGELRDILRSYVDQDTLDKLTIVHRVSKNDREYFPALDGKGETPLSLESESFDAAARKGARMAALRRDLTRHAASGALPARGEPTLPRLDTEVRERLTAQLRLVGLRPQDSRLPAAVDEVRVSISALRHFLECPLQGAARYALGMQDDESEEPAEDEPLELTRLDHAMILRDVFWKTRAAPEDLAEQYRRAFEIAQMKGRAPAGSFGSAAEVRDTRRLARWRDQLALAGVDTIREWEEIRLGPADEFAAASTIIQPLTLDVQLKRFDGTSIAQRVTLYGSLGRFAPARDASFQGILRKESKPRDFVAMILGAIALAATEQAMPPRFSAIAIGGEKAATRIFSPPDRDAALAYLGGLIADLLSGENSYFFPIEAAAPSLAELAKRAEDRDFQDVIEKVRENTFTSCGSDYGPIRGARRFDSPSDEQIVRILTRRYAAIAAVFEREKPAARPRKAKAA
jgi:exodeoxyribonuclease V gamma subunit